MGLAKALKYGLSGLAGGLTAVAEVGEAQDKEENVLTRDAVKEAVAQRKAIRKAALEDYKDQRESQKKIETFHGNMYGIDQETGMERPLTREEIGALINTIGEEDLKKYASEKRGSLVIKSGTKAVDTEVDTSLDLEKTAEDFKTSIPEGKGIAKGQQDRVAKDIERTLARMNIGDPSEKPITTRTYANLSYNIVDTTDGEIKRGKDYTFTADLNGQEVNDVTGFVSDDGRFYINDLRFIGKSGEPIRATADKFSAPTVRPTTTKSDDTLADAMEFINKRVESTGYEKIRTEIVQDSASVRTLGQSLESMWEYAQDEEIYSTTVLALGGFTKVIKREIAGIQFVFDPNDGSEESRAKNEGALKDIREYISNNKGAEDVNTRRKVLDAMIFDVAMTQATDGQSNPSDKDLLGQLRQLEAGNPAEFFQKAEQMWNRRTNKLKNTYDSYINNNPIKSIDFSGLPPVYSQAKSAVMAGKEIRPEDVDLPTPAFLVSTTVEELQAKAKEQEPAEPAMFKKSLDLGDGQSTEFDVSIEGTGPEAKVTFRGPNGTTTTTFKEALEEGLLTAEDIK